MHVRWTVHDGSPTRHLPSQRARTLRVSQSAVFVGAKRKCIVVFKQKNNLLMHRTANDVMKPGRCSSDRM